MQTITPYCFVNVDLGVAQKGCSHYRAHQNEGAVLKLRAQALGTEDPQFSEQGFGSEACTATNTPETWSKYLSSKEPSSMFSRLFPTVFLRLTYRQK